jgi:hypothetical protein
MFLQWSSIVKLSDPFAGATCLQNRTRSHLTCGVSSDKVIGGSRQLSTLPNPLVLAVDIIFCQKLKILRGKSLLAFTDGYSLAITSGEQG